MREIKFRLWDKSKNRMWVQPMTIKEMVEIGIEAGEETYHAGNHEGDAEYPFENCELMQFTGLLDKNGKEIYEGDVIYNEDEFSCRTSWGDATDENPDKRIIVFREDGKFDAAYLGEKIRDRGASGFSFCKTNCENLFEVIGNQFQNPELLKP